MTEEKRKKRVLLATDYYSPHWTGIVKAVSNLVKGLHDQIDFSVITVRYSPDLPQEETLGGAKIIRSAPSFQLSRANYSLSSIIDFWRAAKQVDTVLINSPCTNILPYAIVSKLLGKRLVIFHQGDLILREGFFNRIVETAFTICTILGFALADVVSSYTFDYAKNSRVMRWFLPKCKEMQMPIYEQPAPAQPPEGVLPLARLKEENKIVLGFGGRFVREKGFDVLFKAIPKVVERFPNAVFVFAGAAQIAYENFFQEIENDFKKVNDHVVMLGLLPEQDLWSFYRMIDYIVISSRSDCFPLVQTEACLVGKPSVVTDIPGARYLVKHTGFGVICKPEDPESLADAIITLISNPAPYAVNYPKVKAYFEIEKTLQNARETLCPS